MVVLLTGILFTWLVTGTPLNNVFGDHCTYDGSLILKGFPPDGGGSIHPPTSGEKVALAEDLMRFHTFADCYYRLNHGLNIATKLTTLTFAFLTTIASALQWTIRGIIFGAVATALVAFQSAFPFGDDAQLFNRVTARTDGLAKQVRFLVADDPVAFERVVTAFQQLREEVGAIPITTPTPAQAAPSASPIPSPTP